MDTSQKAKLQRVEQEKSKANQAHVHQRLNEGRDAAEKIHETVAPKSGYLDTQLFPNKKEPKAYENDYSFPDPKRLKKKVRK